MTKREEELKNFVNDKKLDPTIEEFVFIEEHLRELREMPFIVANPNNTAQQKTTPAAKQYKELMQQYTNILKILWKVTGADETEEDSPLRVWINGKNMERR